MKIYFSLNSQNVFIDSTQFRYSWLRILVYIHKQSWKLDYGVLQENRFRFVTMLRTELGYVCFIK